MGLLTGDRAGTDKLDQRSALGVRSSLSESSGANHGSWFLAWGWRSVDGPFGFGGSWLRVNRGVRGGTLVTGYRARMREWRNAID